MVSSASGAHSLSLQLLSRHLHFVLILWVFKMIKELRVYGPGAKSLSLLELRLSGTAS